MSSIGDRALRGSSMLLYATLLLLLLLMCVSSCEGGRGFGSRGRGFRAKRVAVIGGGAYVGSKVMGGAVKAIISVVVIVIVIAVIGFLCWYCSRRRRGQNQPSGPVPVATTAAYPGSAAPVSQGGILTDLKREGQNFLNDVNQRAQNSQQPGAHPTGAAPYPGGAAPYPGGAAPYPAASGQAYPPSNPNAAAPGYPPYAPAAAAGAPQQQGGLLSDLKREGAKALNDLNNAVNKNTTPNQPYPPAPGQAYPPAAGQYYPPPAGQPYPPPAGASYPPAAAPAYGYPGAPPAEPPPSYSDANVPAYGFK